MDRLAIIQEIKRVRNNSLTRNDIAIISMLENPMFPDISITRYLEIKADYRQELYKLGIDIR